MSIFDILKSLENKFSYKKEAFVCGIRFELTILSYGQDQLVSAFPEDSDDPLSFYEKTRLQILSYSIIGIDNEKIPDIIEIKNGDKTETKEKAIYLREKLKNLPPKILDLLFDVYVDFKDEIETMLDKNVEYKWYKTPDVREAERKAKSSLKELSDEEKESEELSNKKETKEGQDSEDTPIVFTEIIEKNEDDKVVQE